MDNSLKLALKKCLESEPNKSTSEAIYTVLRDAIVSFQFSPGEKMVISRLAEEMEVSMTPVRDAICALEKSKLLVIGAGKKVFVPAFDQAEYEKLQDYRTSLETLAAVLACDAAADDTIQHLHEVIEENIHIYETLKLSMALHATLIRKDLEFHKQLVYASENSLLIKHYEVVFPRILFSRQFFSPLNYLPIEYPLMHRLIMQALTLRKKSLMRQAMEIHFDALSTAKRTDTPFF